MATGLTLIAAPTTEPISVPDARAHLNLDTTDYDNYLLDLIKRARAYVEWRKNLALLTQTWEQTLDGFPGWQTPITLQRWPIQSITSVKYTDSSGTQQTWSATNYIANLASNPPRLSPTWANWWPIAVLQPVGSVVIRFVAGFADPTLMPWSLRQAILWIVGDWFANREDVTIDYRVMAVKLPRGADDILDQFGPGHLVA